MMRAAVLGSPIQHSLSPLIHNRAYEILGFQGQYESVEVTDNDFKSFFQENKDFYDAFSLTMPLKEVPISVVENVSALSRQFNTVNTLIKNEKSWSAQSTDILAFSNLVSVDRGSKVAILGAGGTARAAIGGISGANPDISIFLRTEKRKAEILKVCGDTVPNFRGFGESIAGFDFIISTVPVGSTDQLASELVSVQGVLLESLYSPWPTKLAAKWLELGGSVISGLDLLVEQALFQIQLMTKIDFDFNSMRIDLLSTARKQLEG